MKAQRRFGLDLSWLRVTVVFLIDILVLFTAGDLSDEWQPTAWWVGVGVATVLTLISVITYRGITLPSAIGAWFWDWSADPEAALTAACMPALNHQRRYGRQPVGVREYRGRLVTVIAVDEPDAAPAGRHLRHQVPSSSLRVATVAAGLRQFDVRLDGVDIVSVGTQIRGGGHHSTWLVLRMDPLRNSEAVASRDSLASTLAAATERLAHEISGRRCTAWPMSGDDLAEVDSTVLAGLQPTWSRPGWRRLKHFNGYATNFWVSPWDITSEKLEDLWLAETDATVVTVRVAAHNGGHQVSALVRYHSEEPLPKTIWAGLNRFTGRQLPALRAGLTAPVTRPLKVPSRSLSADDELAVPIGRVEAHAEPAA